MSRNRFQSLIVSGHVLVNSDIIRDVDYSLKYGDEIFIEDINLEQETTHLTPDENVEFSILYEDEDIVVINKPAGVIVHPGAGNLSHTLVNGLLHHCGKSLSESENRPGIVHRIDKDTSGILVVAKNNFSHNELAKQFVSHTIKRKYICFCHSVPHPLSGKVETFVTRDKKNRLKMSVSQNDGKKAVTFYKTLKNFSGIASKVECELKTGRTHQVRLHMSHIGCSLIGDSTYKNKNYAHQSEISIISRQALHAYFLEFNHPSSGKLMHFETALPEDMDCLEIKLGLLKK